MVYALWQIGHGGLGPADLVTVLGLPLAVVSVVATVMGLRRAREGTEAGLAREQAATLARLVAKGEGRVLTQLLGRDTPRINLRYDLVAPQVRAAQAPVAGMGVADGSTGLPDIAAYYRGTRPARLVITGAPGAGKTVLTLQLLLALIENREDADPVPVRVPLSQWDTETPLRRVLVQWLVDTYNLPRNVSDNLVEHELVLPMLDGLDEMDPALPNGDPDPAAPRARAALEQLNSYQHAGAALPLVLICRTKHYNVLTSPDLLLDAAQIAIAPVDSSPAAAYLATRARDLPRWQPLLDHLAAHPQSVQAVLLSTPWRLCLTATVYHRTGDPAELLTHLTADHLDDYLLARYITAATLAAADANPHGYNPRQIHHWLHQLANHLAPTPLTPARTDMALETLWPMAGRARIRNADALLATLAILATLVPLFSLLLDRVPASPTSLALGFGAFSILLGFVHGGDRTTAKRLNLQQLSTPDGVERLLSAPVFALFIGLPVFVTTGLAVGLPVGVLLGPAAGLAAGLTCGLAVGLCLWLVVVLMMVLAASQSFAAKPGTIISEDVQLGLVVGLLAGLMTGLACGLAVGLWFGLAFGFAFGFACGLEAGGTAWRYVVFLLFARGRVPFRLARFLDWSCDTGLMRYSGPAYQFRHRELQLWLAAHPAPVV